MVGATGLVGGECLRGLAADGGWERITAITRRPLPHDHGGRVNARIVDFDRLERHATELAADHVFCALGTTIRKAGSKQRFREVDHDYPMRVARLGLAGGARHFSLVSAIGADPDSRFFYNRVKGELERDLSTLGFPGLAIFRPSILIGHRQERRPAERLGLMLLSLVPGRYHPVHARAVAAAMLIIARQERSGVRVIESEEIRELGGAG